MTDLDGLLKQVLAQPHDDTVRLVYADCLEEHGHKSRAAFIRYSIQLDRGAPAAPEARLLRKTCVGLFDPRWVHPFDPTDVRRVLAGPNDTVLATGPGRVVLNYARGFVYHVQCPIKQWIAHGDAVRAAHPVGSAKLTGRAIHWTSDPATKQIHVTGDPRGTYIPWDTMAAAYKDIILSTAADGSARGFSPLRNTTTAVFRCRWPGVAFSID